jgi:hypothetical protein
MIMTWNGLFIVPRFSLKRLKPIHPGAGACNRGKSSAPVDQFALEIFRQNSQIRVEVAADECAAGRGGDRVRGDREIPAASLSACFTDG